jgi:hypothetical protein
MAQKIHPQSISATAERIINKHARKKSKVKNPPLLSEGTSGIAGLFFWLPVFKMLVKAELIDKELNPGKFMTDNGFVTTYEEVTGVKAEPFTEQFVLTDMGLDFLYNIIDEVSWENLHVRPVILPLTFKIRR